jgi:hypothetical protein
MIVAHLDDNHLNNSADNLAWWTRSQNERHKHRQPLDDYAHDPDADEKYPLPF